MNIKKITPVELKEYDVSVKPYLTYSQIQNIVNTVNQFTEWAERETIIDAMVICYTVDISMEEFEEYGHDELLCCGFIDAVKNHVKNLKLIYKAVAFNESLGRTINKALEMVPALSEKLEEVK